MGWHTRASGFESTEGPVINLAGVDFQSRDTNRTGNESGQKVRLPFGVISLISALRDVHLRTLEQIVTSLQRTATRRQHLQSQATHLAVGERGEDAALFYLRREGYVVVARRWRNSRQRGDLDLIAWQEDTLCFIEVKTRSTHGFASAESAVDVDKRRILRRLARMYLKTIEPPPRSVRFDVVAVYLQGEQREFILFQAAFGWAEEKVQQTR